jgi:probable HAF family extracellular repeat protein
MKRPEKLRQGWNEQTSGEDNMKSRVLTYITTMTLLVALAATVRLPAQGQQLSENEEHIRYRVVDLGTFGGHNSGNNFLSVIMNNAGAVTGFAETLTPDPFPAACVNADCLVSHAYEWRNGVLTDLGSLPGGGSSFTVSINSDDQIVGLSENGLIDPVTGIPEQVAAVWQDGRVIDLGTFGGGFSLATMNNDRQQVVGCAYNDVPDPFTIATSPPIFYNFGIEPRQLRAFRWQGEEIQDLGTLGGPDACAVWVNERGQIAGASFTNSIANPTGLPTLDPFLWENGRMLDLGTLGGTIGLANIVNNRGQVAGVSGLAGDQTSHPFLWPAEDGKMRDLGTLGGSFGMAEAVNDAGEVVGASTNAGDLAVHAFFWKQGVMTDLGTVGGLGCSSDAHSVNSKGQAVGGSFACGITHALLWQDGHIIDLNAFVPPGSGLLLTDGNFINDAGQIVVVGLLPNGDTHSVVLLPCEEGDEDCGDADEGAAAIQGTPAVVTQAPTTAARGSTAPSDAMAAIRARMASRFRRFGMPQPPIK